MPTCLLQTPGKFATGELRAFIFPRREYSTQSRKAWVEMRGALVATLLFDVLPQYFDK